MQGDQVDPATDQDLDDASIESSIDQALEEELGSQPSPPVVDQIDERLQLLAAVQGNQVEPSAVHGIQLGPVVAEGNQLEPLAVQGNLLEPTSVQGNQLEPAAAQGHQLDLAADQEDLLPGHLGAQIGQMILPNHPNPNGVFLGDYFHRFDKEH